MKMSKANLYKYHQNPNYDPARYVDSIVMEYGNFINYYNDVASNQTKRCGKKRFVYGNRLDKQAFYSNKFR